MAMAEDDDEQLSRAQRRSLRRIYNGRSVPIIADGRAFLTYKDASQYLQSLAGEARDAAYADMKAKAKYALANTEPHDTASAPAKPQRRQQYGAGRYLTWSPH